MIATLLFVAFVVMMLIGVPIGAALMPSSPGG